MPLYPSTYYPKIYRDFKEIDGANYRRIIHFYEGNEEAIRKLDVEEYFELLQAYTNALFEVGYHQKHLLMIDNVLEEVIMSNIKYYQGEDIFQKLLFRKAASLYNLHEFERAKYVLEELVRIAPYREDAIQFLKKCLRRMEPTLLNHAKATTIFLLLLTAFIICIEVLFIRPFYQIHVELIQASRFSTFFLACSILVLGYFWHYLRVENRVNRFLAEVR